MSSQHQQLNLEFYQRMANHFLRRNGFPTIRLKLKIQDIGSVHHLPFCSPVVFTDLKEERILEEKLKTLSLFVNSLNKENKRKYFFVFYLYI